MYLVDKEQALKGFTGEIQADLTHLNANTNGLCKELQSHRRIL